MAASFRSAAPPNIILIDNALLFGKAINPMITPCDQIRTKYRLHTFLPYYQSLEQPLQQQHSTTVKKDRLLTHNLQTVNLVPSIESHTLDF